MSFGATPTTAAPEQQPLPANEKAVIVRRQLSSTCATTGAVTTLAGSGSYAFADGTGSAASFRSPDSVAYSLDGSTIAVADQGNHCVRLIDVATGAVTTVAGSGSTSGAFADGTGSAASFNHPAGLAYSADGSTIAVAEYGNQRVRLIDVATGAVTTLAGSGSAAFADGTGSAASFNNPYGLAYSADGSTIAVADTSNQRVRLIDVATGAVTTLAGSGSGAFADGTGSTASFYNPTGVAYSADDSTIAVADQGNNRVRLIDVATAAVTTLAGSGSGAFADGTGSAASFYSPRGVAYSADGSTIAVADYNNQRVRLIDVATAAVTTLAGSGSGAFADGTGSTASFYYPSGVDYSPDGSIIAVADYTNQRVREICARITPAPTAAPTTAPTTSPTPSPTATPTMFPTPSPTTSPTPSPTATPTMPPTPSPTTSPTPSPTATPTTPSPTTSPTPSPTAAPTNEPTDAPTPLPTTAGYDNVFEVNANMTIGGFATADDFTSSHKTAMEKALSQEIGQSTAVTDVADVGGGVVIVYHMYLTSPGDTAAAIEAITLIAANETTFVSVVTEKFDDEAVATPSGFRVDAALAMKTTTQVEDGWYFSTTTGKWQRCSKGKSPNENKDSCDLCPEGSHSTEGVCVECNAGETASALRDRCDQELDDPLYKQVREPLTC
jgi:DNA-binding beta-propeller fold protein YncE